VEDFRLGMSWDSSVGADIIGELRVNEDGDVIFTLGWLAFTAIDDSGREAHITISAESGRSARIETKHNDIVPGFNYDRPGVG